MPNKYATMTPLRGGMFYAKSPARDVFDIGPYPTVEDALEQIPDALELEPGQDVEIGLMVPWHWGRLLSGMDLLERMAYQARFECGPVANGWSDTLLEVAKQSGGLNRPEAPKWLELNQALHLVVDGWLARHEVNPAFGMITQTGTFRWNGELLEFLMEPEKPEITVELKNETSTGLERAMDALAAKEPEPEPKWDRCTHTGENMVTLRLTRCCLRAGHSGPHGMEEVPTEVERCHSYPEQISNIRGRCELPVGHAGPHQWEVPPNQVLGRFQCRHVRPDGKRCNIFSLPSEDHQEHRFTCGKPTQPSDERSEKCDLDEGHQGPCQAVPF